MTVTVSMDEELQRPKPVNAPQRAPGGPVPAPAEAAASQPQASSAHGGEVELTREQPQRTAQQPPKLVQAPPRLPAEALQPAPPPLNYQQLQAERDKRPAFVPTDPLELAAVREDTAYACISSVALKAHGHKPRYRVPDGFVGLLMDPAGASPEAMLAGEEAAGDFLLHLFRGGSLLLGATIGGLTSSDGFDVTADAKLSVRMPQDKASLKDFLANYARGSSHVSTPLLKTHFDRMLREAVAPVAAASSARDLLEKPNRDLAEDNLNAQAARRGLASGVKLLGLDALAFTSVDYQRSIRKNAERERDAEQDKKKREIESVIMREQAGAALSREELSEVLTSLQHKNKLKALEAERERIEREAALSRLEKEYRAEHFNLESALRKMLAANELEIDRLKFQEYLRMTAEVRERLQEDRIEFYINQIKDEGLKADLIRRLIEKDMTAEQLRELAALERVRSERLKPLSPTFGEQSGEQKDGSSREPLADDPFQPLEHAVGGVGSKGDLDMPVEQSGRQPFELPESEQAPRAAPVPMPIDNDTDRRLLRHYDQKPTEDVAPAATAAGQWVAPFAIRHEEVSEPESAPVQRFPLPAAAPEYIATSAVMPAVSPFAVSPSGMQEAAPRIENTGVHFRDSIVMHKPQVQAPGVQAEDSRESIELIDTMPVVKAIEPTAEAIPHPELQTIMLVAGRGIYVSHMHGSGRAAEIEVFVDLDRGPLGSLRSVKVTELAGRKTLLVGARRGLYSVDVETRRVLAYPLEAAFNPLTGVNAALAYQGKYYATHSQFGLLRWAIGSPNFPAQRFFTEYTERARSIRSLFLDDNYWPTFACGNRILAIEHDATPRMAAIYSGAPSDILLVTSLGDSFYAACEDGSIVTWEKTRPDMCQRRARTRDAISAATMSTDGSHMMLATRSPQVRVFNLASGVLARYDAPQDMRLAREYGKHIFGITRSRTTLYLWESYGTGKPVTELPLPDACFDVVGL